MNTTINKPRISNKRNQKVASTEKWKINKDIMIKKFRDQKISERNIKELINNISNPQGISFSHNVKFPQIDNVLSEVAGNTFNNVMNAASGPLNLLKTLAGQAFNFNLWLSLYLATYLLFINSNSKWLTKFRYLSLTMMILTSVMEELETTLNSNKKKDERKHFWQNMYPEWQSMKMDMSQSTEEINMQEISVPQGIEDLVPSTVTILTGGLSLLSGYKAKDKLVSSIIALTKISPTQHTNITNFLIKGINILGTVFKNLEFHTLSEYFYIEEFAIREHADFMLKSNTFLARMQAGDLSSNAFYAEIYGELVSRGEMLVKSCEKNSYDYRVMSQALAKLRDVNFKVMSLRSSLSGTRIEPVGMVITGTPGSMKTEVLKRISALVCKYTIPAEWQHDYESDPNAFVYECPQDKFFDGYTNKAWVVTQDDIFQARDAVGDKDSDAFRVIKAINTADYVLPIGSVDSKNSVYFRSPFFFTTTNMTNFDLLESIWDKNAVKRRFVINLEVKVALKYLDANGNTDYSKLPTMNVPVGEHTISNATSIPNDFWCIKMTVVTGVKYSKPIEVTIEDVAEQIIIEHHKRIENFYVNKHTNEMLVNKTSQRLEKKFGKRDFMSNLFSKSMSERREISTPQGLPGSYELDLNAGAHYQGCCHPRECICTFYDDMTQSEKESFMRQYFLMVSKLRTDKTLEILNAGMPGLCHSLAYKHVSHDLTRFLCAKDYEKFFLGLYDYYSKLLEDNINPSTNIPFEVKTISKMPEIFDKIKNTFEPTLKFIENNKTFLIVGGILLTTSIFWITGLLNSFIPDGYKEEPSQNQSVDLNKQGFSVGRKPASKRMFAKTNKVVTPQGIDFDEIIRMVPLQKIDSSIFGPKGSHSDVLTSTINKYHYIVYIVRMVGDTCELSRMGHAVNVTGKLFILPFHYVFQVNQLLTSSECRGGYVIFMTPTGITRYSVTFQEFTKYFYSDLESSKRDICLISIPSANQNSVGCKKYFILNDDYERLTRNHSAKGGVIGTYLDNKSHTTLSLRVVIANFTFESKLIGANWKHESPQESIYEIEHTLRYDGSFASGDCGSLAFLENNNFGCRIFTGIHVAGGVGHGNATLITQEIIDNLIKSSLPDYEPVFEDEEQFIFGNEIPIENQGCLLPIVSVIPSKVPSEVFKSEYKRSVIYGRLPFPFQEVVTFPARTREFTTVIDDKVEIINPFKKALGKYRKYPPYLDAHLIDLAVSNYEELITTYCNLKMSSRHIIPIRDALHTFMDVRGIASSTSSGYPMSLKKEDDLKKIYFQSIYDNDLERTEQAFGRIAKAVQDALFKISNKTRPLFIYKDCLKDELRKLPKIREGSTRMFSACDFTLLLMFRMYFGAFISDFTKARFNVGSAIGTNVYSTEWDDLSRKLLKFSDNRDEACIGAGDFSGFDTNEFPIIMDAILDMINRWYNNSEDNVIRTCLWAEITNSVHIGQGSLYQWISGMPSGNPLTTIINTIYNNIIFRIAFIKANLDIKTFNEKVYLIAYGDDNAFSCTKDIREAFNELTLPKLFAEVGMKYTTELKETAIVPFRPINSVSFLKRSFILDRSLNRYIAPIEMESILYCLNWTKRTSDAEQITVDMLCNAVRELTLHGKEVFDQFVPQLIDIKNKYLPHITPNGELIPNYKRIYSIVLNEEFVL